MDFVGAIKAGFKNYVNFRGTATRPEYWYWVLFSVLVAIVLGSLDRSGNLGNAFSIATLLPSLGVLVRRLREAGFSWLWVLLPFPGLIPFVVGVAFFIDELIKAGITEETLRNPELISQETLNSLAQNDELLGSIVILLFSSLYLLVTYLVVNVIIPIRRSKSFEQGNKRVAPKGPETPAV
jgi:uncharacterized membrane protein YhaH (DUF805 family)